MAMKLRRTVATYEACTPEEVASGSKAQMMNFVADAQRDIGTLADVNSDLLEQCKLFERVIEYQIKVSTHKGDDEGARLQSLTLHQLREVLAKAGA